jgi:hypothetical protein
MRHLHKTNLIHLKDEFLKGLDSYDLNFGSLFFKRKSPKEKQENALLQLWKRERKNRPRWEILIFMSFQNLKLNAEKN